MLHTMGETPPQSPGEAARTAAGEWLAGRERAADRGRPGDEVATLVAEAAATRALLVRMGGVSLRAGAEQQEAERLRAGLLEELARIAGELGSVVLGWMEAGGSVELRPGPATVEAPAAPLAPVAAVPVAVVPVPAPAALEAPAAAVASPAPPDPPSAAPLVTPPPPRADVAPVPAPPAPVALRTVDLGALRREVGPAWGRSASAPDPRGSEWDRGQLARLLERIGPPAAVAAGQVGAEIDRIDAEVDEGSFTAWPRLPARVQRLLISMIAARCRYLQDRPDSGGDVSRLNTIFSLLTRYQAAEQPGFVNGLSRQHGPKGATWLDDARVAWGALRDELPEDEPDERPNPQRALAALQALLAAPGALDDEAAATAIAQVLESGLLPEDVRLLDLLSPRADALQGALGRLARFKRIRRALRERAEAEGADDGDGDGEADAPVPDSWPLWSATRGHRAVLIGGDQREEARARIQRSFQMGSLEWVSTDHIRGAQQLAHSIRTGGVDLAIVLRRFIGHEMEKLVVDACNDVGIPCVGVDRGYGVTQVRLALERALARKAG